MFPKNAYVGNKEDNLSIALLGNRVHSDQTMVEYLIEFLLVFASAKCADGSGRMRFHSEEETKVGSMDYYVKPYVALRRFIFYNGSKLDSRSKIDTDANRLLWDRLRELTKNGEDDVDLIHDLLHSYTVVTKNRGWYAQALLPVAPQFLMPDLQGIKLRQTANWDIDNELVDTGFIFDKHNFLARGGQVLYLHLLQGLMHSDEAGRDDRAAIEALLKYVLTASGSEIGLLSDFIESEWEGMRDYEINLRKYSMGYIRDASDIRSARFAEEVRNFLSCDIHPIARIELLSQGLVLSLLRSMHITAAMRIGENAEPLWIMDMSGLGGTSNIAKLAAQSYAAAYDSFLRAMALIADEKGFEKDERFKRLREGKTESADIFKNLGKQMKLVIPPRGGYERFSLSEALARYLVLALVPPRQKVTLDTFLDRLYTHFRIVIGPAEYARAAREGSYTSSANMSDYFEINQRAFQGFLKQCGFLRDLSDATAIVENPYEEVELP